MCVKDSDAARFLRRISHPPANLHEIKPMPVVHIDK
jgi:hypothetical protein